MVRSRERGRGTPVREPTKILPSHRRRRRGLGHGDETAPLFRSSAEVVTQQVCAQGARSGVSARGRATAGVGSETAKRWARKHHRRPPLFRRGHRSNAAASDSVLAPAGRRRRRRCRLKKASGAPRTVSQPQPLAGAAIRLYRTVSQPVGTLTYLGSVWEPRKGGPQILALSRRGRVASAP